MKSAIDVSVGVRYSGDPERLGVFYKVIGVDINNGMFEIPSVFVFYSDQVDNDFDISFAVNKDLDRIEGELNAAGFTSIESGFDAAGPYFVTKDPAGMRVKISMSLDALRSKVRHSVEKG